MQNNLTNKEINNLYNWAKKYNIKELQTKDINELLNLKELTLGNEDSEGENFSYIPNEIFKLVNLESLYIYCYDLEEIPNDIGNLINLKNLTIESSLKTLPKEIFNLINLETINIDCYCLEELPDGISNLTKLKTLNFTYCEWLTNLKEFPIEIFNLKNLENIRLMYFSRFKGFYKKINDLDNIKNIELELCDFDESEFPKEILELSKLKTLDMYSDNGDVDELPAEIGNLINLKKLNIGIFFFYKIQKSFFISLSYSVYIPRNYF